MEERRRRRETTSFPFNINDDGDVLVEILKRLDARSLAVAARVCRLWAAAARADAVWEHLCFRHSASPAVRSLVGSLGGYRRLYRTCVHPALSCLRRGDGGAVARRVWPSHGAQVALSLFCVDYYERRISGGGASSLTFLMCSPVNV